MSKPQILWAKDVVKPAKNAAVSDKADVDALCESTYELAMAELKLQIDDLESKAKKDVDSNFHEDLDGFGQALSDYVRRRVMVDAKFLSSAVDVEKYELQTTNILADDLGPALEAMGMETSGKRLAMYKINGAISSTVAPYNTPDEVAIV